MSTLYTRWAQVLVAVLLCFGSVTLSDGNPAWAGGDVALAGEAAGESRTRWWVYIGGAAVAGLLVGGIIAYVQQRRRGRKVTGK